MFGPSHLTAFGNAFDQTKIDKLDPMQNQLCRVCEEPAAGFHFGAFTCEGCKSFFGRTCNNQSVIQECKNNYRCVINKKNRTACKACRLRKCLMVGMSKSGSRYGRRSNWFKIHCLMQQVNGAPPQQSTPSISSPSLTSLSSDRVSSSSALSPPTMTTSPSTGGLWRPLDTPSPRSAHSDPIGVNRPSARSPSHSPDNREHLLSRMQQQQHQHSKPNGHPHKREPSPPEVPISLAPRFPPGLYSPFATSLPFLPPTFNFPALASLPIHKQALLSPLLASSHMLAAAAARKAAYPFFPYDSSGHDIFAEHKAFLERFRSTIQANSEHIRSASNNHARSNASDDDRRSTSSPIALSPSPTPLATAAKPASPAASASAAAKAFGQPANPIDLTKRPSSDAESSSSSSMGSEIIPNLSDTDPEEEEEVEMTAAAAKRPEEVPLDLTCA